MLKANIQYTGFIRKKQLNIQVLFVTLINQLFSLKCVEAYAEVYQ